MSEFDDLEGEVDAAAEVRRLAAELDRTRRQLWETKHKHADYLEAVTQAVTDAVALQKLRPVPAPLRRRMGRGKEEVCVPLLSDLQTGKVTPDYNSDVCAERVMRYAKTIVEITEIQRHHHPVRHCVIPMLGDMVEGVDIFPGQQWLLDSTLYRQVFDTTPVILADFCRYLLRHFDTVRVEAVQGNHGRIARKGQFGPEDNADRMVYRVLGLMLRDESRFTLNMADPFGERAWYKIMEIGKYRAMLIHGDQIRGAMGYPFYGLGKKVHAWASGGVPESFQDLMLGHWHQLAMIPMNHRRVWQNGSTESTNTFASEMLAAQSRPSQWLLYVEPGAGRTTASYPVELT